MKIAILGQEGYIGTALTAHLQEQGHEVCGLDNGVRSIHVMSIGSQSITEKQKVGADNIGLKDYEALKGFLVKNKPDTIVHLAEQPSASWSMSSPTNSAFTQKNNIIGTLNLLWAMREVCPDAHLIKLGTEGEYPDWLWNGKHIPEGNRMKVAIENTKGFLKVKSNKTVEELELIKKQFQEARESGKEIILGEDMEYVSNFKEWEIPTPRYAGSWYHFSKLHDSMNIDYACRIWGLTATDVNQGIVYGHRHGTRLDADQYFGTAVHRFVAQAVAGLPLSVYGTGGQTRGFICLQNSIEAIQLLAESPPEKGEFRVIHQTTEEHNINSIAKKVQKLTGAEISYIENPRTEMAKNNFTFDTSTLDNLGLNKIKLDNELPRLIEVVEKNKDRIITRTIKPTIKWN